MPSNIEHAHGRKYVLPATNRRINSIPMNQKPSLQIYNPSKCTYLSKAVSALITDADRGAAFQ